MKDIEEQELERYLQRASPVTRAYAHLPDDRPSSALDQVVIARARAALTEHPRHFSARLVRWPTMTALAATVLLSFAVVMRIALTPQEPPTEPAGAKANRADSREPKEADQQVPAQLRDQSLSESPVTPATMAPTSAESMARAVTNSSSAGKANAAAKDSGLKRRAPATTQSSGLASSSPTEAPVSADAPAAAREEAPVNSAGTGTRAPEEEAQPRSSVPTKTERTFGATSAQQMPEPAATVGSLKKSTDLKPPEQWLEEIEQLRASGQIDAADRELALFRKSYPGYEQSSVPPPEQ